MLNIETLAYIGGGAGSLWLLSHVFRSTYDWCFERWVQLKSRRLEFAEREQKLLLNSVRHVQADENGRMGIMFDGRVYRSLDSYAVFEQSLNRWFDPIMEQLNQHQKLLLALHPGGAGAVRQVLESSQSELPMIWPARLDLQGLFRDRRPSIHDLVIGARPTANGNGSGLDIVSLSLHELMHTLTVGASGWGKSTWLRALLWQIARAREPIEIVAIDTSGSEFNVLRDWGKLRWPVARTLEDAQAVLAGVSREIDLRRSLFEANAPIASKLVEYNQATGADLPPWLVVVDEGTHLLNQPGVGEPLREAVQTARQYGVYILVAGQSAKHSVIDTQVRDNFSSRLCFKTSPTSSRVVLDDRAANELTAKGRMIAQLVGREQIELQGPFVTRKDFLATLTGGGPRAAVPQVMAGNAGTGPQAQAEVEAVLAGYDETGTISGAARLAFGGAGSGDHFYKAKAILEEQGRI